MKVGRTVDLKISTYLAVPISKCDKKTGSVKNAKTSELKELVVNLSNIMQKLNESYLNHSRIGWQYTPDWLKSVIHSKMKKKNKEQNNIDISPQLHELRAKKEAVHTIYLTREEIEFLHNSTMPNADLENARDWLVISCNTAQLVSDFNELQEERHGRYC